MLTKLNLLTMNQSLAVMAGIIFDWTTGGHTPQSVTWNLKNDGWEDYFPFWDGLGIFSGAIFNFQGVYYF